MEVTPWLILFKRTIGLTFVSLPEPPVDLAASSEYIATLHALTGMQSRVCVRVRLREIYTATQIDSDTDRQRKRQT